LKNKWFPLGTTGNAKPTRAWQASGEHLQFPKKAWFGNRISFLNDFSERLPVVPYLEFP